MADRLSGYTDGSDSKFAVWMKKVDAAVNRMAGVSVMDLPNLDFFSLFSDGISPSSAAKSALTEAGW